MTREEKARRNQEAATNHFITKKAEIDALIKRIADFSEDHFGADPDAIHWGDTGSLDYAAAHLNEIAEFLGA